MTPEDRFQALIRHPDYRGDPRLNDRHKYELELSHPIYTGSSEDEYLAKLEDREWCRGDIEYGGFLRVWGLNKAVDPQEPLAVAAVLKAIRAGDVSIFQADLRSYFVYDLPDPDLLHLLPVVIDLGKPTNELLRVIGSLIDTERGWRKITVKRTRSHSVDLWDVWDKMQVPGSNLLKVTHMLSGVKGNPTYNEKTKRAYERVQRAYHKAGVMIEEVGKNRAMELSVGEINERLEWEFERRQI